MQSYTTFRGLFGSEKKLDLFFKHENLSLSLSKLLQKIHKLSECGKLAALLQLFFDIWS